MFQHRLHEQKCRVFVQDNLMLYIIGYSNRTKPLLGPSIKQNLIRLRQAPLRLPLVRIHNKRSVWAHFTSCEDTKNWVISRRASKKQWKLFPIKPYAHLLIKSDGNLFLYLYYTINKQARLLHSVLCKQSIKKRRRNETKKINVLSHRSIILVRLPR